MEKEIYLALPVYEPAYEATETFTPFWSANKEEAYSKAFAWIEENKDSYYKDYQEEGFGVLGWRLNSEQIYFGVAVYKEPYYESIEEPAQGSSIEEVKEKLSKWIEEHVPSANEKKEYFTTVVWRLNPDGSVSWTGNL